MRWGAAAALSAIAGAVLLFVALREPEHERAPRDRTTAEQPRDLAPPLPRPAKPSTPVSGIEWHGRVVDAKRRPLEDVSITVRHAGAIVARGATGARGQFRLRGGKRPKAGVARIHVELVRAGGQGARRTRELQPDSPARVDLGTIRMGESFTLAVTVLGDGAPVSGALVVTGPRYLPGPLVRTDAQGVAHLDLLEPGKVAVRAAATGFGRAGTTVEIPREREVTLALPPERVLTLKVVEKRGGAPVAGATFGVHVQLPWKTSVSIQRPSPPLVIPPTDEQGVTRVRGLTAGTTLLLAVRAPGYPPPRLRFGGVGTTRVPGNATEYRIELEPARTVRWKIVELEQAVPPPPDGAAVTLQPEPGSHLKEVPPSGVMRDGYLVVPGWGPGPAHAIAVAPDGALARLWAQEGEDGVAFFRAPRHVDVFAHEPDGTPVAGAAFVIRNQGNNPMAPVRITDESGRLRFESLYGYLADLYVLPDPQARYGGRRVGTVDLEKGSTAVEIELPPVREILVRVTVAGKPRLPRTYALTVDGATARPEEDTEKAELRLAVRPLRKDGRVKLRLDAPGYLRAEAMTGRDTVTLELKPEGALVARVLPPTDGEFTLTLEHWQEPPGHWQPVWHVTTVEARGDTTRYGALEPGRYRVRDTKSGATSEAVEVTPGAGEAALLLDLSRTGMVRGRVELPAGIEARHVELRVDGIPPTPYGAVGPHRVRRDQTFELRVPGDRPVRIRAFHPLLLPENEATVTVPRDDIVLRLVRGPTATLVLDKPIPATGLSTPATRVLLFRDDEAKGEPVADLRALRESNRFEFGGYTPGTYTVWLDAAPYAPVSLRGVVLGDGRTDLGTVPAREGAGVRVRIVVKQDQAPPRIYLAAHHLQDPRYSRGVNSYGGSGVLLRGLGAGKFTVTAMPIMGGFDTETRLAREVELDGEQVLDLEFDLR